MPNFFSSPFPMAIASPPSPRAAHRPALPGDEPASQAVTGMHDGGCRYPRSLWPNQKMWQRYAQPSACACRVCGGGGMKMIGACDGDGGRWQARRPNKERSRPDAQSSREEIFVKALDEMAARGKHLFALFLGQFEVVGNLDCGTRSPRKALTRMVSSIRACSLLPLHFYRARLSSSAKLTRVPVTPRTMPSPHDPKMVCAMWAPTSFA